MSQEKFQQCDVALEHSRGCACVVSSAEHYELKQSRDNLLEAAKLAEATLLKVRIRSVQDTEWINEAIEKLGIAISKVVRS